MLLPREQLSAMLTHLRARWGRSTSSNSPSWCCRHCLYPQIHQSQSGSWGSQKPSAFRAAPEHVEAAGLVLLDTRTARTPQIPAVTARFHLGSSSEPGMEDPNRTVPPWGVSMCQSSHTCGTLSHRNGVTGVLHTPGLLTAHTEQRNHLQTWLADPSSLP